MEPGRCSIHGLILAEDGKCVICRRGGGGASADEPRKTISDPMWAVIIGGVVLIGAGAWFVFADPLGAKPKPPGESVVQFNRTADPTTPVIPEAPPPRKTTVFVNLDPPATSSSAAVEEPVSTDPTEQQIQAAMRQVKIVMFSAGSDPFCEQVRTFLRKRKYNFTDYDIEKSETDRVEMQARDRSGTLPVLDVEGQVLVGFDRQEFESTVRRIAEARIKPRKR